MLPRRPGLRLASPTILRVLVRLLLVVFACATAVAGPAVARESTPTHIKEVAVAELPQEARHTLLLIKRGGPFPYARDGTVFGNFERLLPLAARGYYREYTVRTAGAAGRGTRRIVASAHADFYYTDDHYRTFRRIRE